MHPQLVRQGCAFLQGVLWDSAHGGFFARVGPRRTSLLQESNALVQWLIPAQRSSSQGSVAARWRGAVGAARPRMAG